MCLLDTITKDRSAIKRLREQVQIIVDNVHAFQVPGKFGELHHNEIKSLNSDLIIYNENRLMFVLSSDSIGSKYGFNSVQSKPGSSGLYLSQGIQNTVQKCFYSSVQNPFVFSTADAMALLELSEESLFQSSMIYNPNELRYMYGVKHYVQEFNELNHLMLRINTKHLNILEDYVSNVVQGYRG